MSAARAFSLPIVDPHMHLWDLTRHYYAWLQDEPLPNNPAGDVAPIAHRSYGVAEYLRDTAGFTIAGCVHVECGLPIPQKISETDWLTEVAARDGLPSGLVAGAVLEDEGVEALLAVQAERKLVRGIRQIVNYHDDPLKTYGPADLLENEAWRRGFALLEKFGLSFDLQLYPRQMNAAAKLAAAHPATAMIVNHTGMPTDRDEAGLAEWRAGMALLAAQPNVSVKISGLGMVDRTWTVESIRPFVLHTIDLFGPQRCMFASNFPVDSIHGSFAAIFGAFDTITASFTESERRALFADTARRVYRLN